MKWSSAFFLFFLILTSSSTAFGTVFVDKGIYLVSANVIATTDGPVAVFNVGTLSELNILLTGKVAKKLHLDLQKALREKQIGLSLKLKIKTMRLLKSPRGSAELVSYDETATSKIPKFIKNNFK